MKNLLLLTLLAGATVVLTIICWYWWPKSAKNKPLILLLILAGACIGCITTLLLPQLLTSAWWIFSAAEVVGLLVGTYISMLISLLRLNRYKGTRLILVVAICYVMLVSTLIYSCCYWAFVTSLTTVLLWRAQVLVLPATIIIEMGKAFYYLPPPAYAPWVYPLENVIQEIVESDMDELLVVGLRITKSSADDSLTYFRARAPLHISWGDFFYHFLNDYNEKHPEQQIEVTDAGGNACYWQFFRVRNCWPAAIIDYNRPVQFTGIRENSVIVCVRV
ncbi:hypothetical protein SAMN05444266_104473 [Chitinophaga jiangningensis]|uniref:TssN family type VI secretion system protein n=1 Tax=Chitinophaga jiangningensis TaxID=1419482 RepID=A0A1M7CU42_9BACT|nr:TssN family type VI secretion system protein [Chitinophaga jiangningensis]SHL70603.1 hypothetical protein SAMN05444266_104473 [Chitinophaga jiangningensis]